MRNRYVGKCELCGIFLPPKTGRWRSGTGLKMSQNFKGLRCIPCGTTTKRGLKETRIRLNKLTPNTQ